MKKILLFLCALLATAQSWGSNPLRMHYMDSVKMELAHANTLTDSIDLYYDMFDLAPRLAKKDVASELYELAVRASDNATQLDMLRHLTQFNFDNDSLRLEFQKKVETMSPSSDQRMSSLFINIVNSVQAARFPNTKINRERLQQLIDKATDEGGTSVYTRLETVMALCAYLEGKARNRLLVHYLKDAEDFISKLSSKSSMLDIYFMAQAASDYLSVGESNKSVETDKRLIAKLDSMESQNISQGRQFRNYDYDRYNSYRRLLYNYEVLTPEEVEYYYAKVQETARQNQSLYHDTDNFMRPTIYYYLAKGRYAEAIPLLFEQVNNKNSYISVGTRLNLVNQLIKAIKKAGSSSDLLAAYKIYHEIQENNDLYDDQAEYIQLQYVYETNSLNIERNQMEVDKRRAEKESRLKVQRSDRMLMIAALVVVIILIIVVLFMTRTWRKMKKLDERRAKDNAALMEERDTLRRTQNDLVRASEMARQADSQREEFIDNVSNEIQTPVNAIVEYSQLIVDCIDDDKQSYLDRFASVVKLNAELLSTLVSDVLEIASHDKGTYKIEKRPVSVQALSTVAIDSVKDRIPEGVEMIDEIMQAPDVLIDTDAKRVAQVLMNLLSNSAKFTTEGSIKLSGALSPDGKYYTFSVTDTGIGIPAGKEEEIFERFKKLSKYTQGVGLGLPVGRIIAGLLDGELKVDTTYTGRGSRFIFTIPVN